MYKIDQKLLKNVCEHNAKNLVSKVMHRFEILNDKEALKAVTKELIYESNRDLLTIIKALNGQL